MIGRVTATPAYDTLVTADLVLETVPESVAQKRDLLAAAEHRAPDGIPFATGTSAIVIAELASARAAIERQLSAEDRRGEHPA